MSIRVSGTSPLKLRFAAMADLPQARQVSALVSSRRIWTCSSPSLDGPGQPQSVVIVAVPRVESAAVRRAAIRRGEKPRAAPDNLRQIAAFA